MAGLKNYEYTNDRGYTTVLQMTDEDAKRRGLLGQDVKLVATKAKPAGRKAAAAPKNKAAQPAADKADEASTGEES